MYDSHSLLDLSKVCCMRLLGYEYSFANNFLAIEHKNIQMKLQYFISSNHLGIVPK